MVVRLIDDLTTDMSYGIYGSASEFGPADGTRQLWPTTIKPRYEARAIYELLKGVGTKILPVAADVRQIGGDTVYPSLASLPQPIDVLILSLGREHALRAVQEAAAAGIRTVWFQPATDAEAALAFCTAEGMKAIRGCALRHRTVKGLTRFVSPCFYMGLKSNKLPVA